MSDRLYPANYRLDDVEGSTHLYPSLVRATPDTLHAVLSARGIGEQCESAPLRKGIRPRYAERSLTAQLMEDGATLHTLHMACFVGFLALKANAASIEDVLGDCGLIHEIVHNMTFGKGEPCIADRHQLVQMAHRIEQAIPGHPYD